MSLNFVPSAANVVADAILRPSRESTICLKPYVFKQVGEELGPLDIDLIASDASVQLVPGGDRPLPFFSRYDCQGSSGVDLFAQDVSTLSDTGAPASGCSFPSPVIAGPVVSYLADCRARVVLVVPDVKAYWFPRVHKATVRSRVVALANTSGSFHWPCSDGSLEGGVTRVGQWWCGYWIFNRINTSGLASRCMISPSYEFQFTSFLVRFVFSACLWEFRRRCAGSPGSRLCSIFVLYDTCWTENAGSFNYCVFCNTLPCQELSASRVPDAPQVVIDACKFQARRSQVLAMVWGRRGQQRTCKVADVFDRFLLAHSGGRRRWGVATQDYMYFIFAVFGILSAVVRSGSM